MGSSVSELRRRYGIKGISTIPQWLRKFGKDHLLNKVVRIETMEEKDQIKALQAEIKRLKLALADAVMAKECLEVVIDEANKEYQTDLKKNFGEQGSTDSGKGST
jgi:transposase-like protein